jgi:uncharacterized protein with HEPN domain
LKRGDRERLDDMAEVIEAIQAHADNRRADEGLRRDAILYNLVILGEAVKSLGDEAKAKRPEIPWRQISGLRDLLAHEYYRIDTHDVEELLKRDLGPISKAVNALRRTKPASSKR